MLVGQFNIFRVLGDVSRELRHSNILSWLLTPRESHGLQDRFLKQYLMLVSRDTEAEFLDPIAIDSANITACEILREWHNIDLLIDVTLKDESWLFVIENKVKSKQGSDQLKKYRTIIENHPDAAKYAAHKQHFILLSKDGEEPDDAAYVKSTYSQVYNALTYAFNEHYNVTGIEPSVLIKHYLRLLEETVMEESEIKSLAQKIYQEHKLAIDTIIDNIPVPHHAISHVIQEKIQAHPDFVLLSSNRSYVRFLPKQWNTPENRKGTAWGSDGAYIVIELVVRQNALNLKIVSGRAPTAWVRDLFSKTADRPFTRRTRNLKDNPVWVTYDSRLLESGKGLDEEDDVSHAASKVWQELKRILESKEFAEKINIIGGEIEHLRDA